MKRKLYYGSVGPIIFDDEEFIADPSDIFVGMNRVALATDSYVLAAGFGYLDTDGMHFLTINWNEDATANRTLSFVLGDGNRTLTLNENFTVGDGNAGTITFSAASKIFTIDETATLSAKANLASPTFTGTVTVPTANFTIGSTTFSETQLTDLTDSGDTTLHDHDGIVENTAARHTAVTLNASATTGGLSLSTQEISHRAATNAQTGYATAAHITAIETNTDKVTCNFANVNAALAVANAAIDVNSQNLTSVGAIGCGTITTTGDVVMPANGIIGVTDGNPQIVFDNANNWLEITGSVGIGTTSPDALLDIEGATGHFRLTYDATNYLAVRLDTAANVIFDITSSHATLGDYVFEHEGTSLMRIVKAGHLGIGTGSPDYRLDVETDVAGFVAKIFNDGNNANRQGMIIQCGADDASGTTTYIYATDGDAGPAGYIRNTAGTFALIDASDERLKENIKNTSINGLDIVNNLKVRDFNLKKLPSIVKTGFVAQEVEETYPDIVSKGEDGMLGISKEGLVPVLVKTIQELTQRIGQLESSMLQI